MLDQAESHYSCWQKRQTNASCHMTQACACLYADELVETASAAAIMASLFTQSIVCIISHNRTMLRCSSAAAKTLR